MKLNKRWLHKLATILYFLTFFIGFSLVTINPLLAEVRVAILDSGFATYFNEGVTFTSIPVHKDPLGHGTLMAKIIRQINPAAKIYAVQICEKYNHIYKPDTEAVMKGLEWCIKERVDVINLSFTVNEDARISKLLTQAQEQGIIIMAAAGNKNFNSQFAVENDNIVRTQPKDDMFFPASDPSVISVGAVDKEGKFMPCSCRSAKIVSLGAFAGNIGTSVASARATGIISKMLENHPTLPRGRIVNELPYFLR